MSNFLTSKALGFATEAHKGQFRKYNKDEPYVEHVKRVVQQLSSFGEDDTALICAAYLHDVVEDTTQPFETILIVFGEEVAELVWWLTDLEMTKDKRAIRKKTTAWRISRAPLKAKKIKLADLIDNTPDIVVNDSKFAYTYLKEKEYLLECIEQNSSLSDFNALSDLYHEAKYSLNQGFNKLKEAK